MIQLQSPTLEVDVCAEHGGLIAGMRCLHDGEAIDILRARPAKQQTQDGLPLYGCFPMVPFANRLSQPYLKHGSGQATFQRNWPSEGVAMHGTGYMQPWSIVRQSENSVSLSTSITDKDGMVLGQSHQEISVSNDIGLQIELTYCHTSDSPMAAGLGLHPWFAADDNATLAFSANGRFEMDADHFPVGHSPLPEDAPQVLDFDHDGLDTCFSGWTGRAVLSRPSPGIDVELRSGATLLHCFVSRHHHSICAEPVTHHPDAAHNLRWPEVGQMALLQAGETIATSLQITPRPAVGPTSGADT